jgi:hypothetical protein
MKNLSLTMNRRRSLHLARNLAQWSYVDCLLSRIIFFVIRQFHVSRNIATTENQNLALGLGSLDLFGRQ